MLAHISIQKLQDKSKDILRYNGLSNGDKLITGMEPVRFIKKSMSWCLINRIQVKM